MSLKAFAVAEVARLHQHQQNLEIEKVLARLLGWSCVKEHNNINVRSNTLLGGDDPAGSEDCILPSWTSDDAAAFRLMVDQNIELGYPVGGAVALYYDKDNNLAGCIREKYEDHRNNMHKATRMAIVNAVIAKLRK